MKNNQLSIALICCAVLFCAASAYGQIGLSSGSVDLVNVDGNFWTGGLTPATTGYISGNDWGGINPWSGSISCDGSYDIKPKENGILSLSIPLDIDTCAHLKEAKYSNPQTPDEYKAQYDTLRMYIERCAATDNNSWQVFTTISGAVQFMNNDSSRYDQYRDWLISVLYLNITNPEYFCVCIGQIAETYQIGSKYDHVQNASLAVLNYLHQYHSPTCWGSGDSAGYAKDTILLRQEGKDPTKLPPLDSIGLGFLLNQNSVPSHGTALPSTYLASFTSSPNPFIKETTLDFTLNRIAYVTLAIYDELGRLVWGDGRGSSLEAGTHTIQIDGNKLPSGTLYARIATGFGEVKTVKLIHEK